MHITHNNIKKKVIAYTDTHIIIQGMIKIPIEEIEEIEGEPSKACPQKLRKILLEKSRK